MKKLVLGLCILLICGCAPTAWVLGGPSINDVDEIDADNPKNEYVGRIGILDGASEFGLQSNWRGDELAEQWYGAYGILHLEGDVSSILGRPYIGYQASIAADHEDGGTYGPVLGTVYRDVFVVEGWYRDFTGRLRDDMGDEDQWKVLAGFRFAF
jgi:hypothetical protein